jgi:hypothetical protein
MKLIFLIASIFIVGEFKHQSGSVVLKKIEKIWPRYQKEQIMSKYEQKHFENLSVVLNLYATTH